MIRMTQRQYAVVILMGIITLGNGYFQGSDASGVQPAVVLNGSVRTEAPQETGMIGLDMLIPGAGYPIIQAVFEGSPADIHGMRARDIITSINQTSTLGKSREEIDAMISDIPGTRIWFGVQRPMGNHYFEPRQFQVTVVALSKLTTSLRSKYLLETSERYP